MCSYTTDGGWQLIVASFQCCLDVFIYNRWRVATNSNKFSVEGCLFMLFPYNRWRVATNSNKFSVEGGN